MAVAPARAEPRPASKPAPAARRANPRARPRPVARPRVAGGVLWIGLVAALLAGIVALNVAALRLNVEAEELDARASELTARRDTLATELSSAASAGRIESLAVRRFRLERPSETTYIRLGRPRR
jgi:hypothetical protein